MWPPLGQVALAAALIVLVTAGAWLVRPRSTNVAVENPSNRSAPLATSSSDAREGDRRASVDPPKRGEVPAPTSSAPVVVAFSISPILVRGADEPASLTIAPGTDVVVLQLQGQPGERGLRRGRAIVRTVAGPEIWRGPATGARGSNPQEFARIEIPAANLRADDYIVELRGADAGGREVERYRYFLRVRR
jgi:hypothetical protein